MLTIVQVVDFTVDDGIMEMMRTYLQPHQRMRLEGGVAGFEACRGRDPQRLSELLTECTATVDRARETQAPDYWWNRYYQAQVEWVCNVVSAALLGQGMQPIVPVTVRGQLKYAEITGAGRG